MNGKDYSHPASSCKGVKELIVNSDHNGLSLRRLLPNCTEPTARPVWRYSQADFDKANRLLADVDWEQLLDTPDVNQALQSWENAFKTTWKPVSQRVFYLHA